MSRRLSTKRLQLIQRRQQVAELHLQNWTQSQIATRLGISQTTIHKDLKWIEDQWRSTTVQDFHVWRQKELRKLDRIEREAWAAWERSQKPQQAADIQGDGAGSQTKKRIKNQYGDPRFLALVNHCVTSRRALLGLDAPTKIAPTMPDGESPYQSASLPLIDNLSTEHFETLKQARDILKHANQEPTS